MKKAIISLLVILAIAGVAVVTCPDKEAHKDAIMDVVNEKIGEELGAKADEAEEDDLNNLLNGIATIGSHVGKWYLDSNLTVKNNFVYSVGYLRSGGEENQVSFGIFGHVFTFSKEDLDQALSGK